MAVFYCRKSNSTSDVHHPVVSREYRNRLPIENVWIGTRVYSSQLVVPSALEFMNRFKELNRGDNEEEPQRGHENGEDVSRVVGHLSRVASGDVRRDGHDWFAFEIVFDE